MGFVTNLMYLSLLAQFIQPGHGSVLAQSLVLGGAQIAISVTINAVIAIAAGSIVAFLSHRPLWLLVQPWLMGDGSCRARAADDGRAALGQPRPLQRHAG